jgi:hypothetical protein
MRVLSKSILALSLCLFPLASALAAAPAVISVVPTDGATQVPNTSSLVITFDQAMDTSVTLVPSATGFTGNYAVTAPGLATQVLATWGSDGKSLTIQPALQFGFATYTWTLNPAGGFAFLKLKSQAGVELPTVTGTFTTGGGGANPVLGSSSPANGATDVALDASVTFRFNQAMKTNIVFTGNPGPIVWAGAGVDASKFVYAWSTDKKILTADYTGDFPRNTLVTWLLNPSAASVKLVGDNDKPLAADTYTGSFFTSNGETQCNEGLPFDWGTYGVTKRANYIQASAADPLPSAEPGAYVFSASATSPTGIASGSITRPNGTLNTLTNLGPLNAFYDVQTSEAALDAAYPGGSYVLRFTVTGQSEAVVPMTMPAQYPPVPKIANFAAAQAIHADSDFTLQWNGYAGADADDLVSMYLYDTNGNVVFQAPNLCELRELPNTATSIVIPSDTLQRGAIYEGELLYGGVFYRDTNSFPKMSGFGQILRATYFTVKTIGDTIPLPDPAKFITPRLLPNGNPQFTATGTVGAVYRIKRAAKVTGPWEDIGSVTIAASGSVVYEDTQTPKTLPLYYRLVAE